MADGTKPARRALASRRTRRRGYTLVFFAMMLFGIMAFAALVIDFGFARLTQRQMQIASDSGAVEGLRGEGVEGYDYPDRLERARNFVHWHFDDDLDATGDDGAFDLGHGQFGAGSVVGFSGGAGNPALAASQLMDVDPNNPVYKPVALDGTQLAPPSFQVALRRGPTDMPDADLYANGPAVPYLFARGSLINRQLIQNGITVRGTGEAQSANALSIGFANNTVSPPLLGLATNSMSEFSFALSLDYWNNPTGSPTLAGGDIIVSGENVGRYFAVTASANEMPLVIGRELPLAASPIDDSYTGYVPVYEADRVIGFGYATADVSGGNVTITRHDSVVAAENASALLCYSTGLSATETESTLVANRNIDEPLYAPVSVR